MDSVPGHLCELPVSSVIVLDFGEPHTHYDDEDSKHKRSRAVHRQ